MRNLPPFLSRDTSNTSDLLDEIHVPLKETEIDKDVQNMRSKHVSSTLRSSPLPYSYNVNRRGNSSSILKDKAYDPVSPS